MNPFRVIDDYTNVKLVHVSALGSHFKVGRRIRLVPKVVKAANSSHIHQVTVRLFGVKSIARRQKWRNRNMVGDCFVK